VYDLRVRCQFANQAENGWQLGDGSVVNKPPAARSSLWEYTGSIATARVSNESRSGSSLTLHVTDVCALGESDVDSINRPLETLMEPE